MTNLVTMTLIFMLFVFVALFWYQLAGISTEEGMVASAITIMLLVFGCAMIEKAKFAYVCCIILSIVGIVLFLVNIGKHKSKEKLLYRIRDFVTPSLVIMGIGFLYTIVFFRKALFTYSDEVYQWGNAVKYIVQENAIPNKSTFTGDAGNFSICTMFQYFFSGLGKFKESNAFVGNFLLTFIAVMLPCSGKKWKEWKKVFIYAGAMFLTMNLLSYIKYYTLLQDYVLPMWAGGTIAWLLWNKKQKINWILLFFTTTVIAAMKSLVGPMFSCIIILTALLIVYLNDCTDSIWNIANLKKISIKKYGPWLPLLVTPFLINKIWTSIVSVGTTVYGKSVGTAGKDTVQTAYNVIEKTFTIFGGTTSTPPYMSYVIYFGLYILIIIFLKKLLIRKKMTVTTILTTYVIGAIVYLGVMFYAYMKVFSVSDSSIVAGLDRYLSYYMLMGVPAIVYMLFIRDKKVLKDEKVLKKVAVLFLIVCLYGTSGNFTSKVTTIKNESDDLWVMRVNTKEQIKKLQKLLKKDQGHLFIMGKLNGSDITMITYELGKQYVWSEDSYSMKSREDQEQILINAAKYPQILTESDYKYVWFINPDEQKKEYEYLRYYFGFESTEDGDVYEICEQNGTYKFKYLGNVPGPITKDGTGN